MVKSDVFEIDDVTNDVDDVWWQGRKCVQVLQM